MAQKEQLALNSVDNSFLKAPVAPTNNQIEKERKSDYFQDFEMYVVSSVFQEQLTIYPLKLEHNS